MNAFINYLLEANLGLCFFLLLYWILLKNETDFSLKRLFLLMSILISLIFPLFHVTPEAQVVPGISSLVPRTWLPEVVINAEGNQASKETHFDFDIWEIAPVVYAMGVILTFLIFA